MDIPVCAVQHQAEDAWVRHAEAARRSAGGILLEVQHERGA